MNILNLLVALACGIAGAQAATTLMRGAALPRKLSLLLGVLGAVAADALVERIAATARAMSTATSVSAGVDLARLLGNAAGAALGGIALSVLWALLQRVLRAR